MSVYAYYKDLPPWAKGVVIVGGLAATYFTARSVVKAIKKGGDNKERLVAVKEGREELADLIKAGEKPSFPDSQYTAWADAIAQQFDGCDVNVGPYIPVLNTVNIVMDGIKSNSAKLMLDIVDRLKGNVDFLKLVTAYSVRTYDQCGISFGSGNFTGNLYEAVQDELNSYEIKAVNKLLAEKKITYTF